LKETKVEEKKNKWKKRKSFKIRKRKCEKEEGRARI